MPPRDRTFANIVYLPRSLKSQRDFVTFTNERALSLFFVCIFCFIPCDHLSNVIKNIHNRRQSGMKENLR